jgi:hypothetical protein
MLTTNLPESVRQSSNEEAISVIHAPESFSSWVSFIVILDPTHLTPFRLLQLPPHLQPWSKTGQVQGHLQNQRLKA